MQLVFYLKQILSIQIVTKYDPLILPWPTPNKKNSFQVSLIFFYHKYLLLNHVFFLVKLIFLHIHQGVIHCLVQKQDLCKSNSINKDSKSFVFIISKVFTIYNETLKIIFFQNFFSFIFFKLIRF